MTVRCEENHQAEVQVQSSNKGKGVLEHCINLSGMNHIIDFYLDPVTDGALYSFFEILTSDR